MANYEEYAQKYLQQEGNDDLAGEANEATKQEEDRKDSTPEVDWEARYLELEKHNSRQAQDLGNYRKLVDEYISTGPTPDKEPVEEVQPITSDDIFDNPDEAVKRAVDSHPAIREAEELKKRLEEQERQRAFEQFAERHSDFTDIASDPAFQNWVLENPTRTQLARAADAMDLTAADALFSLYKAEKGLSQVTAEQQQARDIANASLESPTGAEPPAPESYSRSAFMEKLVRSKQGDLEAERYVEAHYPAYRKALAEGNVRD